MAEPYDSKEAVEIQLLFQDIMSSITKESEDEDKLDLIKLESYTLELSELQVLAINNSLDLKIISEIAGAINLMNDYVEYIKNKRRKY